MKRVWTALLAAILIVNAPAACASPQVVPPREIGLEGYLQWHNGIASKLDALLDSYEDTLNAHREEGLNEDEFRKRLMALSIAASELLRESTSVTNHTSPELWGRIAGDTALVAMVYSDIVLAFGRYAGENDCLGTTCDLLRQAVSRVTGRSGTLDMVGGAPPSANESDSPGVIPGGGSTAVSDESPDRDAFARYFKSLCVGRLPADKAKENAERWHDYIVETDLFAYGDIFVMTGEVIREARLTICYYDVESGRTVGAAGETPALKPGPFTGYNVMALPPGRYAVKCYVDGALVAVLPFKAVERGARTSM